MKAGLNVGAGDIKLPGFLGIDIEAGADIVHDVTRGLPFPANTMSFVYSEHFIEHISQAAGFTFFRECRRVLRPGGVVRVATPDLDEIIDSYVRAGTASHEAPPTWLHEDWQRFGYPWIDNRAEMLNLAMRLWGHTWMYNEEELRRVAGYAGLRCTGRFPMGSSDRPELDGLEHRAGSTLCLEFEKPDRTITETDPLVSIVIPAYKPEFLAAALDSALAQSYPNIEIVISDDCPSDACRDLVAPYVEAHDRIRYTRNPVPGGDENYVHGLECSEGFFVKYLNDDDLLHPACVQRLVDAAIANPEATLVGSLRQQMTADGSPIPPQGAYNDVFGGRAVLVDGLTLSQSVLKHRVNFIGEPNNILFRRDDVAHLRPHLLSFGNTRNEIGTPGDVVMWLNLLSQGPFCFVPEVLAWIRVHPGQIQQREGYATVGAAGWTRLQETANRLGFFVPREGAGPAIVDLEDAPGSTRNRSRRLQEAFESGDAAALDAAIAAALGEHPEDDLALAYAAMLVDSMGGHDDALFAWRQVVQLRKTASMETARA